MIRPCGRCGVDLEDDVPDGSCPACLVECLITAAGGDYADPRPRSFAVVDGAKETVTVYDADVRPVRTVSFDDFIRENGLGPPGRP